MNILMIIANPFRPDARLYNEAMALKEDGHKVTVIAWDRAAHYPQEETVDGIHIIRIRVFFPKTNAFLHYFKLRRFWHEAYKKALNVDFDVLHVHDLDALPPGIKLKRKYNTPLLFDVHDIYPYMIASVVPRFVVTLVALMERKWLKSIDRLITVSEGMKAYYMSAGVDPARISLVLNCKKSGESSEMEIAALKRSIGAEGKFLILYLGALEDGRFIRELLETCEQFDDDLFLAIGGFGALYDYVENAAANCSTGAVKFLGFVHPNEVIAYTSCADVIFGMYDPKGLNQILTMPVKVLDALNAGVPIIVTRELSVCKLVRDNDFGLCVPYDIAAFFRAVKLLKNNPDLCKRMGENALRLGKESYNWEVMAKRLKDLYREIENTTFHTSSSH